MADFFLQRLKSVEFSPHATLLHWPAVDPRKLEELERSMKERDEEVAKLQAEAKLLKSVVEQLRAEKEKMRVEANDAKFEREQLRQELLALDSRGLEFSDAAELAAEEVVRTLTTRCCCASS